MAEQPGEPLNDSGVFTGPDGHRYLIEILDMVLRCRLHRDHDVLCYEPAGWANGIGWHKPADPAPGGDRL